MGERTLAPGEYPWPPQVEWPDTEGPFVRVATLCEDVIEERRRPLSVFRLLSRLVIRGEPTFPISIPTVFFVSLENFSTDREVHEITISIACPDGPQVLNIVEELRPYGPHQQYNLQLHLPFPVVSVGQHAVAVMYEGRILTVIMVSVELDAGDEPDTSRPIFAQREETSFSRSGEETRRRRSSSPGVVEETSE